MIGGLSRVTRRGGLLGVAEQNSAGRVRIRVKSNSWHLPLVEALISATALIGCIKSRKWD